MKEIAVRDDGVRDLRQCGFVRVNPYTRNLMAHPTAPGEPLVQRFVALVTPDNSFKGDGAEVWVCLSCAAVLDETYKATSPKAVGD